MPEGVGYKGFQSVANSGLDLSYWGDRAFGYSGEINANNSTETALDFKTSKNGMDALIMWGCDMTDFDTNKEVSLLIKLNGVLVYQVRGQLSLGGDFDGIIGNVKVEMFIPPLTDVLIEVSTNQTNTVGHTVMFTGTLL